MYLILEDNKPFAIVKNATNKRIETAIREEHIYESVTLESFTLPDYDELVVISFIGIDEYEGEFDGKIEIMKLLNY
jgi:hypothetical protein